jgi:hypothetical protein
MEVQPVQIDTVRSSQQDQWDRSGSTVRGLPGPAPTLRQYARAQAIDRFLRGELHADETRSLEHLVDAGLNEALEECRAVLDNAITRAVDLFVKANPATFTALR